MHHGREQGGRPQAATNTTVRCWLARGRVPDGAPGNKTCERFRLRVFFCVVCGGKACAWCTIPYGAGSCCAAVRLAFASRGPVAKNSALHCFLNAPADGAPSDKTCKRYTCGSFFAIGKCFRPDRWAAGVPKVLCTFGGPAMQAPTSKRQGFRKNISLFCDSIVGASMARPLRPCDPARLFGWSRAPPLQ